MLTCPSEGARRLRLLRRCGDDTPSAESAASRPSGPGSDPLATDLALRLNDVEVPSPSPCASDAAACVWSGLWPEQQQQHRVDAGAAGPAAAGTANTRQKAKHVKRLSWDEERAVDAAAAAADSSSSSAASPAVTAVAAAMQHCVGSPQQFCLRWNNYQSNLTNVFDQLLQSESFVDVTLACDGHSVKAHKMVLSACSPYFQSLFFDNPCQHPIVILKDIKWPELKAVVEFMYKGEINVSQEQIGPLLKVAESLKIRGLADVNGEQEGAGGPSADAKKSWDSRMAHDLSDAAMSPAPSPSQIAHGLAGGRPILDGLHRQKKRRRTSGERSSVSSPEESMAAADALEAAAAAVAAAGALELASPPPPSQGGPHVPTSAAAAAAVAAAMVNSHQQHQQSQQQQQQQQQHQASSMPPQNHHGGPPPPSQSGHGPSPGGPPGSAAAAAGMMGPLSGEAGGLGMAPPTHPGEDIDIKPGIAEMIREEERAKLLESSHAWLGASTSSIAADSYQYQLQSMWQKCWNTNQSLVHNLRFRERGPLKSWRPETMAEAIFSVLKEGLSLSQAARKYDIPYPTFVLYANRVHNMLGPSVDGGADLRPKGRGRPQRILLGTWPEEHIRGVIRAVVFRDTQHIKEEPHLGYARLPVRSPHHPLGYGGGACSNGPEPTVSPGAAAAAAVAVVAQGLRQQMCSMVAAAQHGHGAADASLANSLGLLSTPPPPPHMGGGGGGGHGGPPSHGGGGSSNGGVPPPSMPSSMGMGGGQGPLPPLGLPSPAALRGGASPAGTPPAMESPSAATDGPSPAPSPLTAPLAGVELGIGVSGMTYKPAASFTSPRPETLFQEDIEDIVKSPQLVGSPDALGPALKEPREPIAIKVEPVSEGPKE